MTNILVELPARLSPAELAALETELSPYGQVQDTSSLSFGPNALLGISFFSDVLQGADVLVNWLKRAPRGNQAVVRLSDGRTLKMETASDPDAFLKMLKSALKEL